MPPPEPPAPPVASVVAPTVAEVVVRAPRLPPAAGDLAFDLVRIPPERLQAARRVDEALARTPGVALFRRTGSLSANPTTQGLSLRAIAPSGAGRALVTLDGVPLNDPFGGWVIWSQLAPEDLAGAAIVRGAGAGPYGAGALTGVVALQERDAGAAASAAVGDLGSARVSGAVTTDALTLSGAAETSDGYVPVRGPRAGPADTPTRLDAVSGAARLAFAAGDAAGAVRLNAYAEDRGAGLAGANSRATGGSLSLTLARAPTEAQLGWRVQGWLRGSNFANTSVAVAPDRRTTTPANDQFATPAFGAGFNAALRRRAGDLEWELGADARLTSGEERERFRFMGAGFTRERVAGGSTAVAGVYAEATRIAGPWLFTGGARLDRWSNDDARRIETDTATGLTTFAETPPDRSGEVASFRAGVRRRLSATVSVRAAAYQGFRPATLNELHRPFRVGNDVTESNPALIPERLSGAELGLAGGDERFNWNLTAFVNRLDDPIVNVTLGVGPGAFPRAGFIPAGGVLRQRQNAGRIDAVGLEAEAAGAVTPTLRWRAGVSVTDARVDGEAVAPQLTGLRPAQAPQVSASAGLDWTPTPDWRAGLDARYESRRFDDDLNSRRLSPALTLDASVERRLTPSLTAYLEAENLLDANVETSATADGVVGLAAPRIVRAGVRWRVEG